MLNPRKIYGSDDNLAFLWNEYGKIINTISVHTWRKCKCSFHQTINVLLQGGSEGTFVIWNIDGTEVKTVTADKVYVKTVVYSKRRKIY
jgi:WD40 repeat protein